MAFSDTIVALASSAGFGGVGVIRVSGPSAVLIAQRIAPWWSAESLPGLLRYGTFVSPTGAPLDTGLIVRFAGPRSYTGEDVVEFQVHGGAINLSRFVNALVGCGARPAEPGEFSRRAFLNGRVDLAQAEAVADVVSARSEGGLVLAQAQLAGALSSRVRAAMDQLLDLLAALEVQVDFVDEDLGEALTRGFEGTLRGVHDDVQHLVASYALGRVLRGDARVVLAGAPNAGKSSLFNALLGVSRAIVTPIPGTTRDTLEAAVDLGGLVVTLIDTAGLRDQSDDPVEAEGIRRGRAAADEADLVVWLGEGGPGDALWVSPKCDLRAPHGGGIPVSAVTGAGLDRLREAIRHRLGGAVKADGVLVTNPRHHAALSQAAGALRKALEAPHAAPELLAVDVREAVWQLGTIVGATTTDDLLDRVFSQFCIGK